MGAIDVGGLEVRYRQVGDGPTVVLLHGYVGDGEATWHPQLNALGEFRLMSVDVPTLLVYGDQDVRAPRPVADHLHRAIAGSELVVLSGSGHVCNLAHPDQFNATLRSWLLRHP